MQNKKVIITGAAGFIGSHLTDALLSLGAKVWGVDNFITGSQDNLLPAQKNSNFHFIQADVTENPASYLPEEFLLASRDDQDIVFFHLASIASPPLYQRYPRETYLVNSSATDLLLIFLQEHLPKTKFVYASTSEVYGDPLEHPQKESYWGNVNPNGVRSCYDESKRMGETICGVFNRQYAIDTRIARIFNTYGPRMDARDGRIIPNFITQCLAGEKITIYGDGEQTRSYCYVTDLVDGLIKLATLDSARGQTINLGNPGEYTVNQTAILIHQAINQSTSEPEIEYRELPADDPTRRKPDITLANTLLGWQPTVTFAQGILKTIEWFRR